MSAGLAPPEEKPGPSEDAPQFVLRAEERPAGVKRISGDVFGLKKYLHPFLSVAGYYTDNIFNERVNKKGDFITIVSPGIWTSVPQVRQLLLELETSNLSAGGLVMNRFKPVFLRRYQSFFYYRQDIERLSKYSSSNTVSHLAEGLFQYNFRGGLSFDISYQYLDSHDKRGTGESPRLEKFKTNFLNAMLNYELGRRLTLRADWKHFLVDYDETTTDFRKRADDSISGYIFYRLRPKTHIFLQYEQTAIAYDRDFISDSAEQNMWGGLQWDVTAKSKGILKAGYGAKDFTRPETPDYKDMLAELQIKHKPTSRISLNLRGMRKMRETNILQADFIFTHSAEVELLYRLSGKLSAASEVSYTRDRYGGTLTSGDARGTRKDTLLKASLALQYELKEWLKTDAGYIFIKRDSNFEDFDFTNNMFFLRLTGSF